MSIKDTEPHEHPAQRRHDEPPERQARLGMVSGAFARWHRAFTPIENVQRMPVAAAHPGKP